MTPIDMTTLQPLAAPVWFVLFFKILGFILHMLLMNLWLVGLPLALFLHWRGSENARLWGSRLIRQMPIYITFGVNFGIVPLLFIQLLYPSAFYSATILMAWHWISVIILLIPAYYGVYLYVYTMKKDPMHVSGWRRAAGWCACLFFLAIGFLFMNAVVLTAQPELWNDIWLLRSVSGASVGIGSAIREPALFPRWGMMFALGFGTVAVWTLVDRNIFNRKMLNLQNTENVTDAEKESASAYLTWSARFARISALLGTALFVGCALPYANFVKNGASLGAVELPELVNLWIAGPVLVLAVVMFLARKTSVIAGLVALLAQITSLTVYACVRQWIQVLQLNDFLPLSEFTVRTDLGPMLLFLGSFVVGVIFLLWMIVTAVRCCKN
ncbi:MAG: hypothetical protein Q4C70_12605 [Planctomycetia bacterium]|nr:hypothetical protein [Planctomycetia bacterium]